MTGAMAHSPTARQSPVNMTQLAEQQRLTLSLLEAVHMRAVLQSTLEKLALVGVIVVDPKLQAQELTQSVGEEITRMIGAQKELEQRFGQLVAAQPALRVLPNKAKLRENQAELQRVSEALRQATKQLCRNLKDNPNVVENMAKLVLERQTLQQLIGACAGELADTRRITPIVESVLAHEHREVEVQQTIEREHATASALKQLKLELKAEKTAHVSSMRDKRKTLASLKTELRETKMTTAVNARHLEKELVAGNDCERLLEQTAIDDLQLRLGLVRQQIEIEQAVHRTTAEFLQQVCFQLQQDTGRWSQQQQEGVAAKEREIESICLAHQQDSARLKEMQERHREELAQKQVREDKERDEREEAAAKEVLESRRLAAAIRIQAVWRGFKVRRDLAGGKKGGKKGSKGDAKKKKK